MHSVVSASRDEKHMHIVAEMTDGDKVCSGLVKDKVCSGLVKEKVA